MIIKLYLYIIMSEYTDTLLINCSRKSGVEARGGNNTENAIWTNTLQQAVKLDIGDKIEMESVFINEVGSANPSTIEFSGKHTGINEIIDYTETDKLEPYVIMDTTYNAKYRLGKYRKLTTTIKSGQTIPLQDNVAPLIYGYYMTSNEYPQYIQQPRSFAFNYTRGTVSSNPTTYIGKDSTTEGFQSFTVRPNIFCNDDWRKDKDASNHDIYKQIVDNSRFTMFVKDNVYYDFELKDAEKQFPTKSHNGIFSESNYIRIRERLDIRVEAGFNTPSAVAEQVTRQLTETKSPEIFQILDKGGYVRDITKTVSTSTYKTIESVNYWQFDNVNYTQFRGSSLPILKHDAAAPATTVNTQNLTDYIASFAYIGVKRPEIFETGRKMANEIVPNCPKIRSITGAYRTELFTDGDDGFQVAIEINNENSVEVPPRRAADFVTTNIPYTRENLEKIRDFLDAQGLYPELFEGLENQDAYKPSTDPFLDVDVDFFPTRFFHMNAFTTDTTQTHHMDGFGSDHYLNMAAPNNVNHTSYPVMMKWEEENRDLFLDANVSALPGELRLSYGFAQAFNTKTAVDDGTGTGTFKLIDYYTIQLTTDFKGIPVDLFNETSEHGSARPSIREGRRIGFDFHATAFSTCIISPYSGQSNVDQGTITTVNATNVVVPEVGPEIATLNTSGASAAQLTDLSPYYTQVYMGANNPAIAYNGETNRFELVRLHTANNVGNTAYSGNPADNINNSGHTSFLALAPPGKNADSGDTVYKLNPRPSQLGFSSAFKPYLPKTQQRYVNTAYPKPPTDANANTANRQYFQGDNQNISNYHIFDSHGGIYIENFGYSEKHWEDNLWDILGFRYEAVQAKASSSNVVGRRVNNDNKLKLYRPTTNCEVVSTDSKAYYTNRFGANMYYTAPPYPYTVFSAVKVTVGGHEQFSATHPKTTYHPEVSIKTESMSIPASDIQKSVLKPYYAIRSSLLEGYTAIGGDPTGANLPLISVVDKYSAQGDFFFGKGAIQFTITKPTVIADITTAITDPDGKLSKCDESSAIVYKITKLKRTPQDILSMIFQEAEKSQKKVKK